MINYLNLFRALQTDQYDDFSVRDLKEEFNTEPDIDTTHVAVAPEGLNERHGMSIMAYALASMQGKCVIVVGRTPDDPLQSKPINIGPLSFKNFNIEPLASAAQIFESPKSLRHQKQ